jgi:hypothetical protein
MEPSEESFDLPPAATTTQGAPILGDHAAVRAMGRNHLDPGVAQMRVQRITVIAPITDQPRGERVDEPGGEGGVDEADFMRRSTGHVDGERKTMAVANRHDFAALTASSRANGGAPFFAELKLASMKASLRSSCLDREGLRPGVATPA